MPPTRRHSTLCLAASLVLLLACGTDDSDRPRSGDITTDTPATGSPATDSPAPATAFASGSAELSPEELEAGRMDGSWRGYVAERDTQTRGAASPSAAQAWSDISPRTVNAPVRGLPIHGDVEGAAVARVQILLDMNRFSPGIIDGRWGKNTEKAVYWFQEANGLDPTGRVDRATLDALERAATGDVISTRRVAEADISGPFQPLPDDIYARAEQSCLCYESRREQLAEAYHATPELLEQLNPETDLGEVRAGDELAVPAVEPFRIDALPDGKYTGGEEIQRVIISDGGHYLHAHDADGNLLYHFPSTLGADYSPSPEGEFAVESITFHPTWHYQPELLTGVDPGREDAILPAGPNNAVGVVWMQLSQPHYGIHGTGAPETIGYVTSNGCVRLTNWDAAFLARRLPPGTPVEFTGLDRRDVAGLE